MVFLRIPVVLTCFLLAISINARAQDKPNIVYILADDLGYGDLSCYNPESKITTHMIDKLAGEGMLYTDAHSPAAL